MTYPQMDPRRLDLTGTFGLRVAGRDAAEVRIGTAGRWGQRVNLATNPSFETLTGSYVTVRTNLFTRPLLANISALGAWLGSGGASIRDAIDDDRFAGGRALRHTITAANTGGGTVQLAGASSGLALPAQAGKRVTVACNVITPRALSGANSVSLANVIGNDVPAAIAPVARYGTPVEPGEVGTLWATFDLPTGLTGANVNFGTPGWQVDDVILVGDIDMYEGDYQPGREFFHGDYSPDPDLTPTWTGAVDASTSTLSGQVVDGVDGGIASTQRPGLPLRVPDAGHITDWPATGVVRASIDTEDGREALTSPDLAPGWYGRLLIEDIEDGVPEDDAFFDGDTPDTPAALHHWTGTPHASTSVQTLAWTPGD